MSDRRAATPRAVPSLIEARARYASASTGCVRMSHEVRRYVNNQTPTGMMGSLSVRAKPSADEDRAQRFRSGIRS